MSANHPTQLTRREAIATGLATVGAMVVGRTLAAADGPGGAYGPFKMGLQSYSLRGLTKDGKADLGKALAATKDLGLHYWESYIAHVAVETDPARLTAVKSQLSQAGVNVIGYGVMRFTKDHDANRRLFEFAKAMGIAYLSADPDPDSFDSLDKLCDEYGVAIGIHNHGPGHRYDTIDKIAAIIKDRHPKIGCCVDTGHFLRSREDPVRAVEVFGKRTYGVHLKDVKDAKTFTLLGEGDLRTVDLLKALAALKYDYCLALEYEENPESPVSDIRACLAATRAAISKAGLAGA
ncbi:MAG: sugar phosphate isomerase/epimerase [Isosphaeraceae bacterium]